MQRARKWQKGKVVSKTNGRCLLIGHCSSTIVEKMKEAASIALANEIEKINFKLNIGQQQQQQKTSKALLPAALITAKLKECARGRW